MAALGGPDTRLYPAATGVSRRRPRSRHWAGDHFESAAVWPAPGLTHVAVEVLAQVRTGVTDLPIRATLGDLKYGLGIIGVDRTNDVATVDGPTAGRAFASAL